MQNKVLLLGDSIRQNYEKNVQINLEGKAKVVFPNDNGKFCSFTLRYLHEWFKALSKDGVGFDLIHFNCGLWDILRLSNESEPFTNIEEYKKLLLRIKQRILYFYPDAKLIFALTTSVIEPGFEPGIEIGERRNSDIVLYNNAALDLFKDTDVYIDDLWTVSNLIPLEGRSDDVHFDTEIGKKMLAQAVSKSIMSVLQGN